MRSVQITMAEDFGIQGRGAFYDQTGTLRDVVQNHLFQVLCNVTMEPPARPDAESVRDEKVKVLRSVRFLEPRDLVRGQFEGYLQEPGVRPQSNTETFIALRLEIDSWRWQDVPFFIRAGKCLPVTATEVIVNLRAAPKMFPELSLPPNHVRFRLGPDMAIALGASVMEGWARDQRSRGSSCSRARHRPLDDLGDYERVLGDALAGDPGVFAREDYVEEAWRIVDPVLGTSSPPTRYRPGTWGPGTADLTPPWGWVNPAPTRKTP